MLVSFKAASVGLSSVACMAVILAFVKYARTRPVFEGAHKFLNQVWLYITHELKVNQELASEKSVTGSAAQRKFNRNCAFNDIKAVRKALYPYVLAVSSAIIIMSVCGKVAKSQSFVLQMYSVVGAFMSFGAALMAIGLFAYTPSEKENEEEIVRVNKSSLESVVPTLSLAFMGLVVVSYVVNCGLSA